MVLPRRRSAGIPAINPSRRSPNEPNTSLQSQPGSQKNDHYAVPSKFHKRNHAADPQEPPPAKKIHEAFDRNSYESQYDNVNSNNNELGAHAADAFNINTHLNEAPPSDNATAMLKSVSRNAGVPDDKEVEAIKESEEENDERAKMDGNEDDKEEQAGNTCAEGLAEPDWEEVAKHPPASSDVPRFLSARERRAAAEATFSAALDELHERYTLQVNQMLTAAAEVYNAQKQHLDEMEESILMSMTENDKARREMEVKLNESAARAQSLFQSLLMRVTSGNLLSKEPNSVK